MCICILVYVHVLRTEPNLVLRKYTDFFFLLFYYYWLDIIYLILTVLYGMGSKWLVAAK
jgi:hypothetical protein